MVSPPPRSISRLCGGEAAPLSCAGVTTYKAVKMSGARSSDLVAICRDTGRYQRNRGRQVCGGNRLPGRTQALFRNDYPQD